MKLREIILKNFRGYYAETRITIDDLTALIGKNDVGKSTICSAPSFCCSGPQAAIAESGLDRRSAPLIVADLQLQHAGEIHIEVDRTNAA